MYNMDKITELHKNIRQMMGELKHEYDCLAHQQDAEKAYKKGLDEAWDLARRLICHTTPNDLKEMGFFDYAIEHKYINGLLDKFTASEALAKLRDYEARKKVEDEAATFKREILFRGKRIDTGEWVFGSLCNRSVRHPYIEAFEWEGENHPVPVAYDVEPASVGQFTGLEDANGTRIFEGDMFDDYNVVTFCNGGFCVNGDSDISLWLKQTVKGNEYDKKHGPF